MATSSLSNAQPNSSVDKFTSGADPDAQETQDGTDYSDPDSQGEPAVMITQAQADASGMTGAKPGDTFTIKVTVTDQTDDGWNVELEPGSAIKDPGPSMDDSPAGAMGKNSKLRGPSDFGMPDGLGQSPTVLNA